jgi:AcrR family transcriptional regulator
MAGMEDPIRDQLAKIRRSQILDASQVVFAERGFHRATTREIAAAAGVAEGTIYNYFAGKDDLLIGLVVRLAEMENLEEELARALQSDPREFFISIFRDRLGHIAEHHQILQALLPEILTHARLRQRFFEQFIVPTATHMEQYTRARIGLGQIRPVNAPLTTRVVQGLILGLLVLRILGDETLLAGWSELPDLLATLLFDGLAPNRIPDLTTWSAVV